MRSHYESGLFLSTMLAFLQPYSRPKCLHKVPASFGDSETVALLISPVNKS